MQELSQARAAIFDLDGTLVESEPAWELAKRRVIGSLGISIPQEVYDAFVGRGLRGFLTHVLGEDLSDARRMELGNRIGAEADVLLPLMRKVIPEAAGTVRRLAKAGYRVAICSSSPRRHILAAIEQLDVAKDIELVVSGADLPRGKPDPLPYIATLDRLGLRPSQAFAVEDALPGARSAYDAGLAVIGIGPISLTPEFIPYCKYRVSSFEEFRALFPNI